MPVLLPKTLPVPAVIGTRRPAAGAMAARAVLPVAGNVFILAESRGFSPQRGSTALPIPTALSVPMVTAVTA